MDYDRLYDKKEKFARIKALRTLIHAIELRL